jgi:hypothetical protein
MEQWLRKLALREAQTRKGRVEYGHAVMCIQETYSYLLFYSLHTFCFLEGEVESEAPPRAVVFPSD